MNEFCAKKGIKREYSIARTPQQNGVAERKNRTLIEAARTMLADSLLPIQFWAEAVNTACYVLNRVLVTKPQMKTPYEILMGRSPNISFMRPFGCSLTILNTLDQLGKFDGKSEEGYLLGYSTSSKGFRVYNRVTRKVQDCLHVDFLENQENQKGKGPDWMFDLELLTPSMNYIPVRKENVSTYDDVEDLDDQQFIVHGPSIHAAQNTYSAERTADKEVPLSSEDQALHDELVSLMHQESIAKVHNDAQRTAFEEEKRRIALEKGKEGANSTFTLSTANTPSQSTGNTPTDSDDDVPKDGVFSTNSFDDENTDDEEDRAPDYNNMDLTIDVSSTPTLRIHKIHPQSQIIGKSTAGILTRRKLKENASVQHQALLSFIYKQNRTNHKDQQTCLFACFLSQEEPKKVSQALADESWVEAMQEELLQFRLQDVWVLCDLPDGKRVIGTKWVFRNKRDERGTIIKNKARLVAQGYRQEEGVDYDEVFAPVARIEAIRLFLAFASFMGFTVYQMDVKSAFLYGNITEEVYVKQPPGFEDPSHPNKVYRVVKALYGLHQAPRAWYERLSTFLLKHGYRRGAIDKTLFIKKDRRDIMLVQVYVDDIIFGSTKSSMVKDFEDLMQKEFKMSSMGELTFFLGLQVKQTTAGIFLSQDKYVKDILNKFDFRTIKPASTPIEAHKSLGKDEEGEDVDVHLYRSMIGCLMYLTASRPDIMFAVCLCARFQVTPKVSHMHAVKRIFRYLKHQPKLGLWYPKDSPFHLEAFSDSDYAGDNHDRRSTSGGCQYLGRRLVSWQCKKQTIVAISSTEAEYVAAASCCAQVLWMQNQLLDYGFNFMNTEIHIDNESTICIVKNLVLHSKTKHIQIRHHFIRDCYEQRLINVVKVHTDDNVADLLTKGFDLARFNFLVATTSLRVINEVPYIRAMVAGKRVLISEETIRVDLLFDDADWCKIVFQSKVIWDSCSETLAMSPKSTSWEQFGTNIASALVGLATNRKFNFSLMIMNGMLGHISNGTPFIMYPRFIQLFLNKQLEGVTRPTNFLPSVTLPSKVFTFMRKHSPKFSCRITPLTPPMLEVVTALAAEEEHSTSPHSRAASSPRNAQGTSSQSAAHDTSLQGTAASQGTASLQGTAECQGTAAIPTSPNDYTPTDASQTSGGDEGLLDLYALNREAKRLKKQTLSQAKQIHKLKAKLNKLSKFVQPVVKHHAFWVESHNLKKRRKKQRKKHKKKVSSVKVGRNKDEGNLSEEHHVQNEDTADPFFEDIIDKNAVVTPDFERKSDETEEINLVFKPIRHTQDVEPEDRFNDDEILCCYHFNRPRGFKAFLDLYHLHRVVQDYYEHIPPTGLGLVLLGDLTTIWETPETSDDDFWKNQEDWEIIRWRLNESSGVHTLELEDGTTIHMLAERRYPLSRELMIRMLDHGMEVEDESETAITLIHLFILWTTEPHGCLILEQLDSRCYYQRIKEVQAFYEGTAKVHEGTDEVLEGTAQVYESTAHSLFKVLLSILKYCSL
ncbi:putative ribonuclease H-like domain-containing protein [Tanacetum coccineum]